jgi:adenine C2-methylase RlmN of 23S rRNA A2503 and tRNA A37
MISERGLNTFKATGTLPFPAWLVYNTLADPVIRKLYSKNEDIVKPLQKECTNTLTGYQRSKKVGVWPVTVSPREFVVTSHHDILPSGVISVVAYGDEQRQHLMPLNKEAIRGSLHVAGWSLTPKPNNSTECVLMTEVDIKGMLPQKILKIANKKQAM